MGSSLNCGHGKGSAIIEKPAVPLPRVVGMYWRCHAESFTKSPFPTQRPNASVDDSIAGSTSGQSTEQLDLMDVPLDDSSVRNRSGQSDEQLDVVQSLVAGTFWKRRRRRHRSQPPYDKTKCCECRKYKNGVYWGGLWCCWK